MEIVRHVAALVPLEAVEGDADLVERRGGQQGGGLFRQQRAVGGDAHPEAQLMGDGQQLWQLRVQQRLAHHVEIEVVGVAPELFGHQAELRRGQEAFCPLRAGAEHTGEVAHVGDLHIDALEHRQTSLHPWYCTTEWGRMHRKIYFWGFALRGEGGLRRPTFAMRCKPR